MKMVIDNNDTKFYIDTKEIVAIKAKKIKSYYLIHIYLKNGKEIELKCDEEEIDDTLSRLQGKMIVR